LFISLDVLSSTDSMVKSSEGFTVSMKTLI